MNKDQVKGRVEEAKGKVKEVTGKVLDGLLHGGNEILTNTFFTGNEHESHQHEIHRFMGGHLFDLSPGWRS